MSDVPTPPDTVPPGSGEVPVEGAPPAEDPTEPLADPVDRADEDDDSLLDRARGTGVGVEDPTIVGEGETGMVTTDDPPGGTAV